MMSLLCQKPVPTAMLFISAFYHSQALHPLAALPILSFNYVFAHHDPETHREMPHLPAQRHLGACRTIPPILL
uniref:Uncharacterized protein n=1 Tax=mine drainage metagenome TaxID=410659 RepID=E6QRF2_9ZZZZ